MGNEGYDLGKEFKQTFAMPATVKFVGVWDTVSSVGIIPRTHPYTSVNYAVKHFRHALALDERRARFRPNVWGEPTPGEREQDLDIDEPQIKAPAPGTDRDKWEYQAPERDVCDVQEVWFSGCHADVGGGSHSNKDQQSLSYIPLRWMIKECLLTGTGILFDLSYLKSLGINLAKLSESLREKGHDLESLGFTEKVLADVAGEMSVPIDPHRQLQHTSSPLARHVQETASSVAQHIQTTASSVAQHFQHTPFDSEPLRLKPKVDIVAKLFDQLITVWFWWILEVLPLRATYQKMDGSWVRKKTRNFGGGRFIHFDEDRQCKVHVTVKMRMESEIPEEEEKYEPAASNWVGVQKCDMITWVGDPDIELEEADARH
ncbi:hypothetical protein H0H81_008461 [Sphagnurus paluster]|uniref:T6SS Phospholipase effector Tle1-like catalytic domain-containing protein n=1 Tax=Sphagnurus paluster TaxID=117069 RepID=A0A9P7FXF8_9AGAR|nr:hypothetical protein H0H81_008461 [Sphagnurus paluster]